MRKGVNCGLLESHGDGSMVFLLLGIVFVVSRVKSFVVWHGMVGLGISHVHDFKAESVLRIVSPEHVEN